MKSIQGIYTPNVVPFHDDHRINEGELRRYVSWLIDKGVTGLYPNGSTGEFIRIQFKRLELIKTMFAAGNFPEGFREGVNLRGFHTGRGPQPMSPHEMEHFNAIRSKLACLLSECGFAEAAHA